jgi:hypothetical protein
MFSALEREAHTSETDPTVTDELKALGYIH